MDSNHIFDYSDHPVGLVYDKYICTVDSTVDCNKNGSVCMSNNIIVDDVDDTFYSVELISPKMTYTVDNISDFTRVLSQTVTHNDFMFEFNETQGLHINFSHPDQDMLKFLLCFYHFEPIIFQFIPEYRRDSIFAIPLRKIFKSEEDLKLNYAKFYEHPDDAPAKYTSLCAKQNRFELRVLPSNLNIHYINAWISLCCRLLFASVTRELRAGSTFDDLFDFIDVDGKYPINDLKEYFENLKKSFTYRHSSFIYQHHKFDKKKVDKFMKVLYS